ncbi:MAG: ATP-binding protein, partial [Pseudomonadales bacterium]
QYYGQILEHLPAAVCTIDANDRVLTWNQTMGRVTGIPAGTAIGSHVASLPEWGKLFDSFASDTGITTSKHQLQMHEKTMSLNLHKATIGEGNSDVIILIEDITEAELLEQKLLDKERLASVGQLAAGVAHEIGNPVTGIACIAQDLKKALNTGDLQSLPDQILEQTERISTIVESLVNFTHQGNKNKQSSVPIDIKQCVDESIRLMSLSHRSGNVTFVNQCAAGLFISGNPQRLSQVFVNILSNARDASERGDKITIATSIREDQLSVEIIDEGHGISDNHLRHVFNPFYTTKDPGQGTGLGLAIVQSIIEEHRGTITIDSGKRCQGTRVLITLPLANSSLTSTPDSLFSANVFE